MDEQLNDPIRGILPNQAWDAASRGVFQSGFFPEQQSRTLQDAQTQLANISAQPTLEAALSAQNSLSSFLSDKMSAAQNMAVGRAFLGQQVNQQRENSIANWTGHQNIFGPSYAHSPGSRVPQIPDNINYGDFSRQGVSGHSTGAGVGFPSLF